MGRSPGISRTRTGGRRVGSKGPQLAEEHPGALLRGSTSSVGCEEEFGMRAAEGCVGSWGLFGRRLPGTSLRGRRSTARPEGL